MNEFTLSIEEVHIAIEESNLIDNTKHIDDIQSTISDALDSTRYIDNISNLISSTSGISNSDTKAINLAVSIIYENLGANSYIFSIESMNTNIALENIDEFIKKLWSKIKLSINNLWDKISNFWSQHFSSLYVIKRSLEETYSIVNDTYKLKNNLQVTKDKNFNLFLYFNSNKDIDDKTIDEFINTHNINFSTLNNIIKYTKHFNKHTKTITDNEFENGIDYLLQGLCKDFTQHPFRFGEEKHPIISGEYLTVEYNYNEEHNDIDLTSNKEKVISNPNDFNLYLINKNKLKFIIKETITIIDTTIKYKTVQQSIEREFKELVRVYDTILNSGDSHLKNEHKKVIRIIYRINSSIPCLFNIVILSNIKLARAIVNYSNFCLKITTS